jgi:hypothetical protein
MLAEDQVGKISAVMDRFETQIEDLDAGWSLIG